jgi:hypothetical protein
VKLLSSSTQKRRNIPGQNGVGCEGSPNLPAISRLTTENEKTLQASLRLFTLSRQKGLLLSSKTYLKSGCLNSIIENKRYDKKGRTEIF